MSSTHIDKFFKSTFHFINKSSRLVIIIGDVPDDDDSEDEDYYSDYDRETAYLVKILKSEINRLEK